ncbi:E3 ubiquitin-protein ligase MPSR1, partial [Cucurbita argyrosperma subsp. sororia]
MASDPVASELSSAFESLVFINRDISPIAPLFLGFASVIRSADPQSPNPEIQTIPTLPNRFIFFNPFPPQLMVIQATPKEGLPPASKASIKAMPSLPVSELTECVICLEEIEAGDLAKQMPCSHKFHGDCIEKWLELHGSCPICRYQMPIDDEDEGKKVDEEGSERRGEREIWVSFSFDNVTRNGESVQTPPSTDSDHSFVQ